jgi:hypothetical protein
MKDYYLSVIKFPILVSSSLFILAIAFFATALGSYYKLGCRSLRRSFFPHCLSSW